MTLAPPRPPAVLPKDNAHLIGGEWVAAASGEVIEVLNPATGEVLARVPRGGAADVDAAVSAAAQAFPAWRDTSPSVRASLLNRWAALIDERESELDQLESQEVGRPHWGPTPMAGMVRFIAGQADKISGSACPPTLPTCSG